MLNATPVVTLYTKPGCHLCEAAGQVIRALRGQRPFELVARNILDDPDTFERYRHAIPVVLVDGREVARHRLTRSNLTAALDLSVESP